MAVNQIGERVKWDKKSGGFVLGRRGSIFRLHAYVESTDKPLDDLRDTSNVNVILECNGLLLVLDLSSGMARSVKMPDDIVPDDAKLLYVKRKFDGSSVSISSMVAPHLWLRHCNSRLMVRMREFSMRFLLVRRTRGRCPILSGCFIYFDSDYQPRHRGAYQTSSYRRRHTFY